MYYWEFLSPRALKFFLVIASGDKLNLPDFNRYSYLYEKHHYLLCHILMLPLEMLDSKCYDSYNHFYIYHHNHYNCNVKNRPIDLTVMNTMISLVQLILKQAL